MRNAVADYAIPRSKLAAAKARDAKYNSTEAVAELVERARSGARRSELAAAIPLELAEQLAAVGTREQVAARLRAYLEAGADTVTAIPVTAEDPAGRAALQCAAQSCRITSPDRGTAS